MKGKKGATFDNIYYLVGFFALVLFALAGMIMWNSLTTPKMDEQVWDKTQVGKNAKASAGRFYDKLDTIIFMVYVMYHIGILVLAFILRTHPVGYVIAIFLIILLAILGAVFSNVYEAVIFDDDFVTAATSFPLVSLLMANFPKFEVIWGFVTAIVLYGLARSESII